MFYLTKYCNYIFNVKNRVFDVKSRCVISLSCQILFRFNYIRSNGAKGQLKAKDKGQA